MWSRTTSCTTISAVEPVGRRGSRGLALLGLALLLSVACGAEGEDAPRTLDLRGEVMGTRYLVRVVGATEQQRAELEQLVASELAAVDRAMSTWKPDSEISRLNRAAAGEPFELSPATFEVLRLAVEVARRTEGAFDVTVGPLVDAWGFGADGVVDRAPDDRELETLRGSTGSAQLSLEPDSRTVIKAHDDVRVDLSAIAKGYGVDRVAEALAAAGQPDHMVEVGGEVFVGGSRGPDRPWRIGLENPRGGLYRTLAVREVAVASSGNYRNFYELEGQIVAHTIDPRTGRPVDHRALAVSVVDERCALADALATALMVMGPDEGLRWSSEAGVAAIFLVDGPDGPGERESPTFADRLVALQ